jgi:NAD(P)H dehydrogenase (quinone)
MHVLVVYAHPNPQSFCHAVVENFTRGLGEGGHEYEVIDLYGIDFDPVFGLHDSTSFVHETVPELDKTALREMAVTAAGGPIRRAIARRSLRDKTLGDLVKLFQEHQPRDVREQQAKVARAEGLVFIAPVFWMGFPAILKGWFERVFAYGFAYTLNPKGWQGDLDGRVPLLTQQKGLIITPTFFTEAEYDKGWREAMDTILCDWGLKMAGVRKAEHVFFYAVNAADEETRREYLQTAYRLGKDFALDGGPGEERTRD